MLHRFDMNFQYRFNNMYNITHTHTNVETLFDLHKHTATQLVRKKILNYIQRISMTYQILKSQE